MVCLLGALLCLGGCGKSGSATDVMRAPVFPNPTDEEMLLKPGPASSDLILAGTTINVETLETIDSDTTPSGGFIPVVVIGDVKGRDAKVAIPSSTSGVVMIRTSTRSEGSSVLDIALYQLTIGDKSWLLNNGGVALATLQLKEEASQGAGHRSVHLGKRTLLHFSVSQAVQFKR